MSDIRRGERRSSPEALLEAAQGRGRLKIFLGAAPGLGKTYETLTNTQARRRDGVDVVIGVVETRGRQETEVLLDGLETVPRRVLEYKGRQLTEMDLDAVLARKPELVLVDELAHSNALGSPHPKRYLDVEELLAAGVNVCATLNIQHVESLNDVVARITHIRVRETVPNSIIDRADEIEVVDLTPEDLVQRLPEDKVYVPTPRFLRHGLGGQGYVVSEAPDGRSALEAIDRGANDLVVLDLGLPDMDGLDIIRQVRSRGSAVPIIVLSSRGDERGKIEALDLGADDYVTKPFGIDELLARIRAAHRHRLQQEGERPIFRCGDLTVDVVRRIVTVRGLEVKFSPREYELLRLLVRHAGKVLTHKFILHEVWGGDTDIQYLRIYIRALRQKIEADPERPDYIRTETGVGYRLRASDD